MTETPPTTALALPEEEKFRADLIAVRRFQTIAQQELRKGYDYGVIPGTSKPTLLKPGAEKIAKLLGLADEYDILDRQENWMEGFFRYLFRCRLVSIQHQVLITQGYGECNSMEAKYRWREARRKCPECGAEAIIKGKAEYGGGWLCFKKQGGCGAKFRDDNTTITSQPTGRVPNEDIYSQVNTILKMAKKRALVDAALSAGRLSEVFTQDIEDIVIDGESRQVDGEEDPPRIIPARTPNAPVSPPGRGEGPPQATEAQRKELVWLTTEAQRKEIGRLAKAAGWSNSDLSEHIGKNFPTAMRDGKPSTQSLTQEQASELINYLKWVQQGPQKKEEELFPDA